VSGEAIRRLREAWWGQPVTSAEAGAARCVAPGQRLEGTIARCQVSRVRKDTTVIRSEAERLFDALRQADYTKDQNWHIFPSPDVDCIG